MKPDFYERRLLFCIILGIIFGGILSIGLYPYLEFAKNAYSVFSNGGNSQNVKYAQDIMDLLLHVLKQRMWEWLVLYLILLTRFSFQGLSFYLLYMVTCLSSLFCVGITQLGAFGIVAFACIEFPQLFFYALAFYLVSKLFYQRSSGWKRFERQLIPGSFVCYILGIICEVFINPGIIFLISTH